MHHVIARICAAKMIEHKASNVKFMPLRIGGLVVLEFECDVALPIDLTDRSVQERKRAFLITDSSTRIYVIKI